MQGDLLATVQGKKSQINADFQPKWWGQTLGLYLHVPFCATACDFCAFYQVQGDRRGIRRYLEGVRREAMVQQASQSLDTCFWGGGTPGLLKTQDLEFLCEWVVERFGRPREEWTVEMAPSTIKSDKLKALKDRGVTRISMGVQSFDDELLAKLGRQHSRRQVLKAYELVRQEGFDAVNLDLIFAIPGQDEKRLLKDVREAVALEPDHLSTYCLTFEEDTAMYVQLSQGKVNIDPEVERRLHLIAWEELAKNGYEQYEISNYARPGKRCVHNVNTWRMGQWIGLGPAAASQYRGVRYSNIADLDQWLEATENDRTHRIDVSTLTPQLLMEDSLIFGLRMNDGVDLKEMSERFGLSLSLDQERCFDRLEEAGHLVRDDRYIRLTQEGRLVADAIGAALMV